MAILPLVCCGPSLEPEPRHLDRRAAIHHDVNTGGFGLCRGLVVAHAELHPDDLGMLRDRLIDYRRDLLGAQEDINHVDRPSDLAERSDDFLTVDGLAERLRI